MTQIEGTYLIGDLVYEMCDRLGLDPNHVAQLEIFPGELEATMRAVVYRTKVSLTKGRPESYKYLDDSGKEAAQQVFTFRVTTYP